MSYPALLDCIEKELLLGRSFLHLSTGKRVATAADDPVAIVRATRLEARIRSLHAEIRGFNDQISYYQTGEGAASEIQDLVVRMKVLAVQSANGGTSDPDRDILQAELGQLREEVGRIVSNAQFAYGLDGMDPTSLGIDDVDIGSSGEIDAALEALDAASDTISSVRGKNGATMNVLSHRIDSMRVQADELTGQKSRLIDADFAEETANLVRLQILQQAALAVLAQANAQPQNLLRLLDSLAVRR